MTEKCDGFPPVQNQLKVYEHFKQQSSFLQPFIKSGVALCLAFFVCHTTVISSSNATSSNNGCYKVFRDCQDHYEQGHTCSGIYTIKPDHLPAFKVYCDMETDGGGWTVFQRRMDGTVDFYRNWSDYLKGFGDLDGEFWLGLNKIHRLTSSKSTLRVDLQDFSGNKRYAKYSIFNVGDSDTKYELLVDGYTGDAGDSLAYHNGMNFTTNDSDNDIEKVNNCAVVFKGAWWYRKCHDSNLNGLYLSGSHDSHADGVNWYHWLGHYYSLKVTEMKVKHNN